MAGRPSKPAQVIKMENDKQRRTKKEIAVREKGEQDMLTGHPMVETKEVKADKVAHKEFARLRELLGAIGKDDDLYGAVINRYCLMKARHTELLADEKRLREWMDNDDVDADQFISLDKQLLSTEKQLSAVEKSMFDIEKENVMTVAAALRSVPKKPETKKSPLMEALASGN